MLTISLVPIFARNTAGTSTHNAPVSAPVNSTTGTAAKPGKCPAKAIPAQAEPIIPRYICPSSPMLNRFIRNANAAARPVQISGVAVPSVLVMPRVEANPRSINNAKVPIGACPVRARNTPPTMNAQNNDPRGTAAYSHFGDVKRGSSSMRRLPMFTTDPPLLDPLPRRPLRIQSTHEPPNLGTAPSPCRQA